MDNLKWRNGFAVGLVLGIGLVLIVVTFIYKISIGGENSTSDWVSSIAAIILGVISPIAVVLVASTLRATEKTLPTFERQFFCPNLDCEDR